MLKSSEYIKEIVKISKSKETSKGGDFTYDSLIDAHYDGEELIGGTYIKSDKKGFKVIYFNRESEAFEKTGTYEEILKVLKANELDFVSKKFIELVKSHS